MATPITQARERNQIFGGGGYGDQATDTHVSSTIAPIARTAHIESEEVITLAQNGPASSDRQLSKATEDADLVQRRVANANPEFNHRNLVFTDAAANGGAPDMLAEDQAHLDVLHGVASGDARFGTTPHQTGADTTFALQEIFTKAWQRHQSTTKKQTDSDNVNTTPSVMANPFAANAPPAAKKRRRGKRDPETTVAMSNGEKSMDPMQQAAANDGLEFFFGEQDTAAAEDENIRGARHQTFSEQGMRRVGQRKKQSTVLSALERLPNLADVQRGFDMHQRAEGVDFDIVTAEDEKRKEAIERLHFPGAQFLASQGSGLVAMGTHTAAAKKKSRKKTGTGIMSNVGFA